MVLKVLTFLIFLIASSLSLATPPSEVTITYNAGKELLHVVAKHPSDRLHRHYLRKMIVYKNGDADSTLYFGLQRFAWGLEEDVLLKAKPGDKLKIELFCSQGGSGEVEMTVSNAVIPAEAGI